MFFQPDSSTYNPETLPATVLVAENAYFFFGLRILLSAIYFSGTYLFVLPFIMNNMPIKRSHFARQR
jgi:hypothetical protein